MVSLGLILAAITFLGGIPIWIVLAGAGAFITVFYMGLNPTTVPQLFFQLIDSWTLLAIPFFLIGGNIMAVSGASDALFRFANDLIGHFRGGMAAATIVAAVIFSAITGSTLACVVAIGSIAIPPMIQAGYSKKFCMGMVAVAGCLGNYIPPSIAGIFFGAYTGIDIAKLFLAGFLPGIVLAICLIIVAVALSRKRKYPPGPRATWGARRKSFVRALPALGMPVFILGGIYGGVLTPVEAAAVSCVYAVIAGRIFYRGLGRKALYNALTGAMSTTCMIYCIIGAAGIFAGTLTFAKIPQGLVQLVTGANMTAPMFLFGIVVVLLIMGLFLDAVPIFYIVMPLAYPVVLALGINPIHYHVVQMACVVIGQVTPPFGTALFTLSGHFNEPVEDIVNGSIPFLFTEIAVLWLLVYVPAISLFLPNLLK